MQDVNIEGFQLSPQQRRLWQLTRELRGDSPYAARCTVRIRGPLELGALKAVLDSLPARHEILRTTFYAPEEISTPLQVITPVDAVAPTLEYQDLIALDAEGQRKAIEAARERIGRALAADATALAAMSLASLSVREHVLDIGVSGIRCDLVGLKNLVADIARGYDGRSPANRSGQNADGAAIGAQDDALQYADASIWLNDTLESPETAIGRRFWESRAHSASLTSRLPFERDDAGDKAFTPRSMPLRLLPESIASARSAIASHNLTPEMLLLACWQCLLQRTLGSDSVVVGYMTDGRNYAEVEPAVGLFARCLPLAGELPDDLTVRDAARRLADEVREARQWSDCFDWRAVGQDQPGTVPFIPLVFEAQPSVVSQTAQDVVFDIEDAAACVERFRLKLCCASGDDLGRVWFEYDAAVLRDQDVASFAVQLETLFANAAGNPDATLDTLRLLSPAQEAEIVALCGSAASAPSSGLVHRLFEAQAARVPAAAAVVCDNTMLTYAQLNDRANQLAHHLQTLGVGPEVLVGLCVERSVDVAVGILGILKAGGAYVPLDPHTPAPRIQTMIQESGTGLVVSRSALSGLLPPLTRTVLLDDRSLLAAAPASNPIGSPAPEHLAYVLFTSGSTGTPKGVAIEHRQLASYVEAVNARLDLPPGAVFASVTTFAADLGNTAIFPALTTGGCLHIVSEERAADANAFTEYAGRHSIDVLKIVPSHLKALLSSSRPAQVIPKRALVLGGEACTWTLLDDVRRLAPGCAVFNHYGPTETTVGATMYPVPVDGKRPPSATVPIGRPLDHARAYVLDRHLQLVAPWVAGELYIGGAGVARGYLGGSALTGVKFRSDPRGRTHDARMYKTGDRVRMLPGGLFEFLGRIDDQVKIRGFRVELGEVEVSLRRHAAVKDAAALAHEDPTGTRLAAFLVYHDGAKPGAADLRASLQGHGLPDYMIPSSFVAVDTLPLTPNGKLDRRRLQALLEQPQAEESTGDEQLTEWESIVAATWQEFLGVDQIQPRDNFYDLGGHSLMAIQVVTALERRVRVQVSPRDLVFHTLKQFAALCASKSPQGIGNGEQRR